ncbi:PEP-CTERM sorting domain-containing protein [Luteolibacter sp. AS25]|uniref:PEP-CTERM sorting domain-containing protein n=1 Tax=Luteolibacter sp. AS25 TaxID=3135776 RepID=UPI00398AE989
MSTLAKTTAFSAILIASLVQGADSAIVYFDAAWSGTALNSAAIATATVGIETSTLTGNFHLIGIQYLDSITMTVSGASIGNGTFTKSDFNNFTFSSNNALDFTQELVGQTGFIDFNVHGAPPSPNGTYNFKLWTNGTSNGDEMELTSLAPVPEPSSAALLAGGVVFFLVASRRRTS